MQRFSYKFLGMFRGGSGGVYRVASRGVSRRIRTIAHGRNSPRSRSKKTNCSTCSGWKFVETLFIFLFGRQCRCSSFLNRGLDYVPLFMWKLRPVLTYSVSNFIIKINNLMMRVYLTCDSRLFLRNTLTPQLKTCLKYQRAM